jgi:hypothetical protein
MKVNCFITCIAILMYIYWFQYFGNWKLKGKILKKILEDESGQQILETPRKLWRLASLDKNLKIKNSYENFLGYNNCENPCGNFEV